MIEDVTPAQLRQEAIGLLQARRLAEAIAAFDRVLGLVPQDFESWFYRGMALHGAGDRAGAAASYDRAVALRSDFAPALFYRGGLRFDGGDIAAALEDFDAVLALQPRQVQGWIHRGNVLNALGRAAEALESYARAEVLAPDSPELHYSRGVVLQAMTRDADALAAFDRAIALAPAMADAHTNRGALLLKEGRAAEALESFDHAIAINPDHIMALCNRGAALGMLRRLDAAIASFDRAIALRPDDVTALFCRGGIHFDDRNMAAALADFNAVLAREPSHSRCWIYHGNALHGLGRSEEALDSYMRAEALAPDSPDLHYANGVVLQGMKRDEEALAAFDRALALAPTLPDAHINRGVLLLKAGNTEAALASFDRAIAIKSDHAMALCNRGAALRGLRQLDAAIASYDRAIALGTLAAEAWYQRGEALADAQRLDEALASYDRALTLEPQRSETRYAHAMLLMNTKRFAQGRKELEEVTGSLSLSLQRHILAGLAYAALNLCDWEAQDDLRPRLLTECAADKSIVPPLILVGYFSDPAFLFTATAHFIADQLRALPTASRPSVPIHGKIRLAYLSADFQGHATASLISSLIESHDRTVFEVIGISFWPDDGGTMRRRLVKAFDQFHDVNACSDAEVAELMRRLEVDIAVDLKGYTQGQRPGIFARRPAPVQVNYLGFPGTIAADFIDYIIADRIVAPREHQPFFAEQIVHLPDCYQVNDPARPRGFAPSRRAAGLPPDGFVFCSFNNHWKIARPFFDVWMRLLQRVPGSVLWLLDDTATSTLRREAEARGVDPARLIFAPRLPLGEHLARINLADLVLDTLPCGAHTTASDALWMGVPLVTCLGGSFAGRVAASLLTAVGLPDLIAADTQAYEALALRLACDPIELRQVRDRLARNIEAQPLFDLTRFREGLETAFKTMHTRRGEAPFGFDVPPLRKW